MSKIVQFPSNLHDQNVSISDLAIPFLDYEITKGISDETISRVRTNTKLFFSWCDRCNYMFVGQLNHQVFRDYVKYLYERPNMHSNKDKLSKSTISKHVDFLKHFAMFLIEFDYAVDNYAKNLVSPRPGYRLIHALTDEQVRLVFATLTTLQSDKRRTFQAFIFLLLLLDTGLRISEALHLRPKEIDFDRRLLIVIGKRDKQREVPFGRTVSELLQRVVDLNHTERDEYIWKSPKTGNHFTSASVRKTLRTVKTKLGTQSDIDAVRLSPHTFRHTFAKNWIMNGGDPFSLKRILGHETMEMTMKYIHMWGDDLVQKHDSCNPLRNITQDVLANFQTLTIRKEQR